LGYFLHDYLRALWAGIKEYKSCAVTEKVKLAKRYFCAKYRTSKWLQVEEVRMVFEGICIMTNNVSRLAQFYRELFETTSEGNDEHTTINVGGLGVAIWKRDNPEGMNDGQMKEIRKHCYTLMFSSPDVDKTYERAKELGAIIQEIPADQPWGVRAFVMNDLDGNRIDIFAKL